MSLFQEVHTQIRRVGLSQTIRFLERKEKGDFKMVCFLTNKGQAACTSCVNYHWLSPLGYYTEKDLGNPAPPRLQCREPSYFYRSSVRWLSVSTNTPHHAGAPSHFYTEQKCSLFPAFMAPTTGEKFCVQCHLLTSSSWGPLEAEEERGTKNDESCWGRGAGEMCPHTTPPQSIRDFKKNDVRNSTTRRKIVDS